MCTSNLYNLSQIKKPRYFYRGSHTTHDLLHENEYKCFINDARLRIELSSPDPNSGTLPLCYQALSGETRNRTGEVSRIFKPPLYQLSYLTSKRTKKESNLQTLDLQSRPLPFRHLSFCVGYRGRTCIIGFGDQHATIAPNPRKIKNPAKLQGIYYENRLSSIHSIPVTVGGKTELPLLSICSHTAK